MRPEDRFGYFGLAFVIIGIGVISTGSVLMGIDIMFDARTADAGIGSLAIGFGVAIFGTLFMAIAAFLQDGRRG